METAYRAELCAASLPTVYEAWEMFKKERSISLAQTSLSTDYNQASKWVRALETQDLLDGRGVIIEILNRQPIKAAHRVAMFVRSMYRWASTEETGILPRNPVANFRMPKMPQSDHEITVITREEIPVVLEALKDKAKLQTNAWHLYADTQLQTGARTGEVRAMKWSDIDGNKIRIHANYTLTHGHKPSTKTNKPRWVPLNERMQEIFESIPRESDYIFPWNRQAYQSFFRRRMDQLFNESKIKCRYRPYDLRHVAISRWLEAGIPVAQAAKWAGNTSEVIWKHYANSTTEYDMPVL